MSNLLKLLLLQKVAVLLFLSSCFVVPISAQQISSYDKYVDNATTYYKHGKYTEAIGQFTKAIKISPKCHEQYELLSQLADCYTKIGSYKDAILIYNQLLTLYEKDSNDYVMTLCNLAYCYIDIEDYSNAIDVSHKALKIYEGNKIIDHWNYVDILDGLAFSYRYIRDYTQSVYFYKRVVDILAKLRKEIDPLYILSLRNMATCYEEAGDYAKALNIYKDIEQIMQKSNRTNLDVLIDIAICEYVLGNHVKSRESAELVKGLLKIFNNQKNSTYVESLLLLALYYEEIGDYTKAIAFNQDALAIMQQENKDCSIPYNNLAVCYYNIGEYDQAVAILNKLVNTHDITRDCSYATELNNLALCNMELGYHRKSLSQLRKAYDIYTTALGESHPDCIGILHNIATANYRLENNLKLRLIWKECLNKYRNYVSAEFKNLPEHQREILWNKLSPKIVYTNYVYSSLCHTNKRYSINSYNSLLLSKGLLLSTTTELHKAILHSGNAELAKLFNELRSITVQLNIFYQKQIADRPRNRIIELEHRADNIERRLLTNVNEFEDFTKTLNLKWRDVRDMLAPRDVAIEILSSNITIDGKVEPYIAALVLRKGWVTPRFVELFTSEEIIILENIYKRGYSAYGLESQITLYNLIWSKLEPYINEGDNVYFSPDGLLHQINIEVLQDANGRRANEKWNLHRVSSTRELCMNKTDIKHTSAVLYGGLTYDMDNASLIAQSRATLRTNDKSVSRGFIADSSMRAGWKSLPATETEVDAISNMLESHKIGVKTYTGVVGNEESFKSLSGKKIPIIHLATHGFFYKNDDVNKKPFLEQICMESQNYFKSDNSLKRSGLILAGAQRAWTGKQIPSNVEDGILLAEEIAAMDLSGTDLVVLSACETGLGEITSEGVFGLQRAFKKAGVQTLIMSLWKVDDNATSLFMQTFYKHWLDGKSKHEAFSIAQSTVRDNESYSNPYYWAAFIMLD
ncbi:MAG: CHAT domain-containing protein [Alistipes sp.]|nr:CHAT domain-containing protein [Alistipes sp.]